MLRAGLGGASRHACVALSDDGQVLSVCEQERVTRTRAAGFNARTALPDEALDLCLERIGKRRHDVRQYVVAESGADSDGSYERIDHHHAHASTAYLTSPFSSAVIVVCDHETPKVSVWEASGACVKRIDWPWEGPGFADLYSRCAELLGFACPGGDQRLEALARLCPGFRISEFDRLFTATSSRLELNPRWEEIVSGWRVRRIHDAVPEHAGLAAALQASLVDLLLEFLTAVRTRVAANHLCLAGSLFYHSSIVTAAKQQGLFNDVFVPLDPGNAGLAVGSALHGVAKKARPVTPFLGPAYTADEIKQTLDNFKLCYSYETESTAIDRAVTQLKAGGMVGWFDGAMEWGPRALGGRSILANPFAPFALENLNRFLKRREPWRGYALSVLQQAVGDHFEGPADAHFMECDFRPRDRDRFSHVLPVKEAALRVQTVGAHAPARFRRLLEAFAVVSGTPALVNTSFNGFHEPIVCSPSDAVRVFYGSGLDLLVLGPFVISK